MSGTVSLFRPFAREMVASSLGLTATVGISDLRLMLLGTGYTPNLDAHALVSDVSAQQITGGSYVAGGRVVQNLAATLIAANSHARVRANSTAYEVGAIVRPATGNGWVYVCDASTGNSGGSIPTWPTNLGDRVVDGDVTWRAVGRSCVRVTGDNVIWTDAGFSFRHGVLYIAASNRLFAHVDPGGTVTIPGTGVYTQAWDVDEGVITIPVP